VDEAVLNFRRMTTKPTKTTTKTKTTKTTKDEGTMFEMTQQTTDDQGRRVEFITLPKHDVVRYKGSTYDQPSPASLEALETYAKHAAFVRSAKPCQYVVIWPKSGL
jgi:hypothetical protein